MKTFHELSSVQQTAAIDYAEKTLVEFLGAGILESTKALSNREVRKLALAAAEGSQYSDDGKAEIPEVDLASLYFGGFA